MPYQKELTIALNAVKMACRLCRKVQQTLSDVQAIQKKDRSPVTIADLGSQALISLELLQAFPEDPIIGEEDAGVLRDNADLCQKVLGLVLEQRDDVSEARVLAAIDAGAGHSGCPQRFWTVDPIDGTKGFLRGEQYAIALALVEAGEVVLGVLGCPNFQVREGGNAGIFHAIRGQGAWFQTLDGDAPNPISVDSISDAAHARFCESVERAHASHEDHERISRRLGITAPPYRIDSQAKYAAVACGNASVYLRLPRSSDYREKIWDHAAGAIVVTEAGGSVSDFSGNTLDFSRGRKLVSNVGILATNEHLHEDALNAISAIFETV